MQSKIQQSVRKTGIDILCDVPWGTHLCQFYQTKEDLVDILVPYFKAGLENNEFCMWVTSEPLKAENAKAALNKELGDLDKYIKKGQIEILDYNDWYTKSGQFDSDQVLAGWMEKETEAINKGFAGLRLAGNTTWLDEKDWGKFADYEAAANSVISKHRMLAICSYSLDKCRASKIIDIVSNHQFSIIRDEGKWICTENLERKKVEGKLRESEGLLRGLFENMTSGAAIYKVINDGSKGSDYIIRDFNAASLRIEGKRKNEVIGKSLFDLRPNIDQYGLISIFQKVWQTGKPGYFPSTIYVDEKYSNWYENWVFKLPTGEIVAIYDDITEHKLAEDMLRESEEKFRTIFENSNDGILIADVNNGKFFTGNKAICDMLGYSIEEIRKIDISDIHPKEDLPFIKEQFGKLARKEITLAENIQMKRKDGSIFFADINANPTIISGKKCIIGSFRDITERKTAEKKILELKQQMEFVLGATRTGLDIIDSDFNMVAIDPEWQKIYGDYKGKKCYEYFAERNSMCPACGIPKALKTKSPVVSEEVLPKEGNRPIMVTTMPFQNKEGKWLVAEVNVDITERKKAEEKISTSQALLQRIINILPIRVFWKDKNLKFLGCNEIFAKDAGKNAPEDLLGKDDFQMIWKEQAKCYRDDDQSVINLGIPKLDFEELQTTPKGDKIWLKTSKVPLIDLQGNTIGILGTYDDITERKKAEEVLRASEKRYRTLLESLPEKIFLKDKDSVYMSCNENYAGDLKIKAEEIAGKTDYDFFPKELAEKYRADDIRIMKSGKTEDIDENYIRNGLELIIHTVKTPVRDKEGNVTGILGIFRDITAQRQAQNKMLAYQKRLRDLASEISLTEERQCKHIATELHDRIAQNLILFKINLGHLRETDLPANLIEPLDEIYKYIDRIINDVRSLTFDLGAPTLYELGLEAAIREWLDEEVRQKHGIKTEFVSDAHPTLLDDDVTVLLYRAVRELLINIIKHAKAKQVKVSICKEKNKIRINVLDDGIGFIHPIESFASNKAKGFGLFSIRERLNCFGGSLEIDSKPRHGTRVTLVAPIKREKTH